VQIATASVILPYELARPAQIGFRAHVYLTSKKITTAGERAEYGGQVSPAKEGSFIELRLHCTF
jgi:hypothetical protein